MTTASDAVVKAWTNPGICPSLHERVKNRLHFIWPTMYYALLALVEESKNGTPTK